MIYVYVYIYLCMSTLFSIQIYTCYTCKIYVYIYIYIQQGALEGGDCTDKADPDLRFDLLDERGVIGKRLFVRQEVHVVECFCTERKTLPVISMFCKDQQSSKRRRVFCRGLQLLVMHAGLGFHPSDCE